MVATGIESLAALTWTAAAAGVVHTWLGPDHYLPLIGFAKLERWSLRRALGVTLVAGLAHVVLALMVVLAAERFAGLLDLQRATAGPTGWLWCGLGLALLVTAARRRRAEPRARPEAGRAARWIWLVVFVLGPCEWLGRARRRRCSTTGSGLLLVTAAYAAATVLAMAGAVAGGLAAAARWSPGPRAARAAAGLTLAASGGALLIGL